MESIIGPFGSRGLNEMDLPEETATGAATALGSEAAGAVALGQVRPSPRAKGGSAGKGRGRPRATPRSRAKRKASSASPMGPPRRIILIYDATRSFDLKVIQGVADFARGRPHWQLFFHEAVRTEAGPTDFEGWPADGVICSCHMAGLPATKSGWGAPVVAFGGTSNGNAACLDCVHCVAADQAAVGLMGAEHLLQRGFRQLAFCGYGNELDGAWSAQRAQAFAARVAAASLPCEVFNPNGTYRAWPALHTVLAEWLKSLPRPTGLMAANDRRARQIIETCHRLGIRVPEEVAVLGVDDDPLICELCRPAISSIDQSGRQIGAEAAALLDALMSGEAADRRPRMIPPAGVSERRSTDIIAVQDKVASAALAYVRANACDGIKIADVAAALAISRSTLQTRFRIAVGRTLHDEMRRVRIDTARRLLANGDTPIKEVAIRAGFRTVQHLTAVFREFLGVTPAAFRNEARSRRAHAE